MSTFKLQVVAWSNVCYCFLLRASVVPAKFPLCHSTRCLVRTKKPDTAQTELVFTRLVDTASLDSRLHQSNKRVFHNNHVLSLFHPVLSLPVLHAQLFVVLGSTQVAELVVTFH